MTMSIGMITMSARSGETVARNASEVPMQAGPFPSADTAGSGLEAGSLANDASSPQGVRSSDLTPNPADPRPVSPPAPAFADVIADLVGAVAPATTAPADATVVATDTDRERDADTDGDALSVALASVALLPAMQAALGLAPVAPRSSGAAGHTDSVGRVEYGVRSEDLTPPSLNGVGVDRGDLDVPDVSVGSASVAPHARLRPAMDLAMGIAGTRSPADESAVGAPSAAAAAAAATGSPALDASAFARSFGDGTLALRGAEPTHWRPALKAALGERLQVQVGTRSEQAVIRLDPPSLGRIEIVVRHEGGHLQVHLAASNADVLRQLHTLTEGLRQDLVHRHHGEVAVTVSDLAREGEGHARRGRDADEGRERTPGRALADAEGGAAQDAFAHMQDRE